jgi:hypothetical protein
VSKQREKKEIKRMIVSDLMLVINLQQVHQLPKTVFARESERVEREREG